MINISRLSRVNTNVKSDNYIEVELSKFYTDIKIAGIYVIVENTWIKYLPMTWLAYLLVIGMAYAKISNNCITQSIIIAIEFIFNSV